MSHVTLFSKLNSVRMYPQELNQPPQYNTIHFDAAAFSRTKEPYMTELPYYQKALFVDRLTVQVHTQMNDATDPLVYKPKLYLLDSKKNVVTALTAPLASSPVNKGTIRAPYNNYIDPITGTVTELKSTMWVFQLGDYLTASTDSGVYYLQMQNEDQFEVSQYWLSEPILLYGVSGSTFNTTKLFECSNLTNKGDVIVDGWADGYVPSFAIRAEADIREYEPKGVYIGYLQQGYEQQQLNAQSWRTWQLNLGTVTGGVPRYMLEKISKVFECDNVRIDGEFFIYDSGSSNASGGTSAWKVTDSQTKGLVHAKIPIRERWNAQQVNAENTAPLFDSPGAMVDGDWVSTFPYSAGSVTLTDGITTVSIPAAVFYDTTDEDAYLNYLQTTIVDTYALLGNFSFTDGKWAYSNDPTENYTGSFVYVNTRYFKFKLNVNGSWNFRIRQMSAVNQQVVDWGNVGTWPYALNEYKYFGTPSIHTQTKAYSAGLGVLTVHVFHNDNFDYLEFSSFANAKMAYSGGDTIDGYFPAELLTLAIQFQDFTAHKVNLPLDTCAGLTTLFFQSNNCTGFTPALFSYPMDSLAQIRFNLNKFAAAEVDLLFNNFYNNSSFAHVGAAFVINNQTPTAPPTSASLTARTVLAASGWTITTD